MSSENVYRHVPTKIKVGNLELEVLTLGNGSQIDLSNLMNATLPKTFWIDLQFEIEMILGVRVIDMAQRPFVDIIGQKTYKKILHIIHTPKTDDHNSLSQAHAEIPVSREEQLAVLHKMNAPLEMVNV